MGHCAVGKGGDDCVTERVERRLAADYRALVGERLAELMAQAAADAGVTAERAVLRIVMARLLVEEEDPVTLAHAISRVAAVSIQAARVQREIDRQRAEDLTDALTVVLTELGVGGGEG